MEKNERLSDDELMEFIIFLLSYRRQEEKQERIQETVKLAAEIQDRDQQVFTLAGILAFTDKVIDRETANKIRRMIEMTQVAQIFEEEKQQALRESSRQMVIKMIKRNSNPLFFLLRLVEILFKGYVDFWVSYRASSNTKCNQPPLLPLHH